MKLEEAARILGVPLDQITPELLQTTYKQLARPSECTTPKAKERFRQITQAYSKLLAAQTGKVPGPQPVGNERESAGPSNTNRPKDADSFEMTAFIKMFMDLVGIFNEDQSLPMHGKMPPGGQWVRFCRYFVLCGLLRTVSSSKLIYLFMD
jgi:hypothetical protein